MVMTSTTTAIFPWRDSYSVRIPQIDEQHKRLIALINDLHAAMLEGKGRETSVEIIEELARYARNHFTYEEGILAQRRYSDLANHRDAHRILSAQVERLRSDIVGGRLSVTPELMRFLKEWLANHILSADMAYARELERRNAA